jgi:hypothetical protein
MTFYCVYLTERNVELHQYQSHTDYRMEFLRERIVSTHKNYCGAYEFAIALSNLKQLSLMNHTQVSDTQTSAQ